MSHPATTAAAVMIQAAAATVVVVIQVVVEVIKDSSLSNRAFMKGAAFSVLP